MSKHAVILLLFFIVALTVAEPLITKGLVSGDSVQNTNYSVKMPENPVISGDSLLAVNYTSIDERLSAKAMASKPKTIKIVITAYTSSINETDSTPYITASGAYTTYGVAAANFLPLGTKIRLPKIYGDQIFVVEDRLHSRYNNRVDIWLPSKKEAQRFGLKVSEVEIL